MAERASSLPSRPSACGILWAASAFPRSHGSIKWAYLSPDQNKSLQPSTFDHPADIPSLPNFTTRASRTRSSTHSRPSLSTRPVPPSAPRSGSVFQATRLICGKSGSRGTTPMSVEAGPIRTYPTSHLHVRPLPTPVVSAPSYLVPNRHRDDGPTRLYRRRV